MNVFTDGDSDRVFHLASNCYRFIGLGVVLLKERGKLSLNDSIVKYYPELSGIYNSVTVEALCRNTAGILHVGAYTDLQSLLSAMKVDEIKLDGLFFYRDTYQRLLIGIIERITGLSVSDFIEENIFKPLKMKDTHFDFTNANNTSTIRDMFKYLKGWKRLVKDVSVFFRYGYCFGLNHDRGLLYHGGHILNRANNYIISRDNEHIIILEDQNKERYILQHFGKAVRSLPDHDKIDKTGIYNLKHDITQHPLTERMRSIMSSLSQEVLFKDDEPTHIIFSANITEHDIATLVASDHVFNYELESIEIESPDFRVNFIFKVPYAPSIKEVKIAEKIGAGMFGMNDVHSIQTHLTVVFNTMLFMKDIDPTWPKVYSTSTRVYGQLERHILDHWDSIHSALKAEGLIYNY